MSALRVVVLVSMALSVAGCGGGGGEIPLSEVAGEAAAISCGHLFECCTDQELMEELELFDVETEGECRTAFETFAGAFLGETLQRGVDSGRIVYHGDRLRDCYDALASMSCPERAAAMAGDTLALMDCENPLVGQVAEGGACASDSECVSSFCDGDSIDFEGNVTEGGCGTPAELGSPCAGDDLMCVAGAYCDFAAPDGPTCAERLAAGSECTSDDECISNNCSRSDGGETGQCSEDYTCDGP